MSFSSVKCTPWCLYIFALLGLGWAQHVSHIPRIEDVNVSSYKPLTMIGSLSTMTPTLNRPRRATSNAVLKCLAPPQPHNGERKLDRYSCDDIVECDVLEGSEIEPGSQLLYRCNPGYKAEGNADVYCRGRGRLSPIPRCVEVRCASLNSVSTVVSCTRYGKWVNCDSPVPPDTRAEVSCRRGYKKDTDFITTRRALVNCKDNGKWDPEPIRCVPVCGLAITHQKPFISGGTPANVGDFPWHATLYQEVKTRGNTKKVFICGATIIQTNLLLTAAHCVYDETYRTKQDPRKLFVVTGNVFRDYDSPLHNPEIVRKATVKNVYTYCQYYGLTGNYASDIALLELHAPFEFSSILLPACLDDSEYRDQFLEPGAYGRVAGFGRTATSESSANLQTLSLPYIPYRQCKTSNNAARNEVFISSDKFCAGYSNGSAVCEGDSGGGLVFRKGDLWYVMGIVSVGLGVDTKSGERTCDKYSYSLYTKVSLYMTWIQDVLINVERNETYPACSNELTTTETPRQNVTLNGASGCLVPPQPANGEWKLHQDSCQGTEDCRVSKSAVLQPGSQLVYSCVSGFRMQGPTDVVCRLGGKWTAIPTCTGDSCSTKNGSAGVCTLLKSCEPVLQGLIAGNGPENTCGFVGREPIVCCPITTGSTTDIPSVIGTTVSPVTDDLVGDGRGVIAGQKCTEYSASVKASSCPAVMTDLQKPVSGSSGSTGKVRANPMEFPHMVAVGFNQEDGTIGWLCGGTLISANFVLTAAQCTNSRAYGLATWVRVGELNLNRSADGATPLDRRIAERIRNPDYKPPSVYHDIALLRLESPVPLNDRIRPACLYTAPSAGTLNAIATGWGAVEYASGEGSDDLLKVILPLVDQKTCNASYSSTARKLSRGVVEEWMLCAGALGRDTCQGDSGGPLVIYSKKEKCMYDLVGITSFGRACGVGIPGVYTRVYHYIPWIESIVWPQG